MTKQIRKIGSYLITIYGSDDNEVKEIVSNVSYLSTLAMARAELKPGESYTVAKVLDNSKYNKWGVK